MPDGLGQKKGGPKSSELTDEQRKRIADLLEDYRLTRPLNERSNLKLGEHLGIDEASVSKIKNKRGGVGVNALMRLRAKLGKSIDDILGLDPIQSQEALSVLVDADPWPNRRNAIRAARTRGVPERIISKVKADLVSPRFRSRRQTWWELQIMEAWLVQLRSDETQREARDGDEAGE